MTEDSPQAAGELGRRNLLRKGLLAGVGVAAISIATPATALAAARSAPRTAKAAGPAARLARSSVHPNIVLQFQSNWWFCTQCKGLFWSSDGAARGVCAYTNEAHTPGVTNYGVPYGNPSVTGLQLGWNYCTACASLFYGVDVGSSYCPGNFYGNHTAGVTAYDMMVSGDWSGDLQIDWSYCVQCQDLFWGDQQSASYCSNPDYTRHHVGATNYSLIDG